MVTARIAVGVGREAIRDFADHCEKPVINLEVDRNGRPNWEFQAAAAKPAGPAEPSRPAPPGRAA